MTLSLQGASAYYTTPTLTLDVFVSHVTTVTTITTITHVTILSLLYITHVTTVTTICYVTSVEPSLVVILSSWTLDDVTVLDPTLTVAAEPTPPEASEEERVSE